MLLPIIENGKKLRHDISAISYYYEYGLKNLAFLSSLGLLFGLNNFLESKTLTIFSVGSHSITQMEIEREI